MNDKQIRCFLEAARSQNFTFAASTLYMTQSALSKSISSLEKELNLQLFFRDRHGLRLTPGGTVLYRYFSEMEGKVPQWLNEAKRANSGLDGTLKIGYLTTQNIDQGFADYISKFEDRYPNIRITIQYETFRGLLEKLRNREIDVAVSITFEVDSQPDLNHIEFAWNRNLLLIPEAYQLKNRAILDKQDLSLSDFAEETFLTVSEEESTSITGLLLDSCGRAGFTPHFLVAPDLETLVLWLEIGRGIFPLNEEHMLFRPGQIRAVELAEFPPISLSVAWLKQAENPCTSLFTGDLPKL